MHGQSHFNVPPPGSIEFELTDVSDARHALEDLPAGVREREQLEPGFWEQRRRKLEAADRALTGSAIDWLIKLPADVRPRELCEQFPRVVNVIAQAWYDGAQGDALLKRLLTDERGGRRGFPAEVEAELRRLAMHRSRR
jgi:hypothetical protein